MAYRLKFWWILRGSTKFQSKVLYTKTTSVIAAKYLQYVIPVGKIMVTACFSIIMTWLHRIKVRLMYNQTIV